MEKLLKLLNEYEQLNMCRKFDSFEMHTFEKSNGVDRLLEDTVISRRYGFIKRLVDSDKINRDKVKRESKKNFVGDLEPRTPRYKLLILLSISNTPIEDLISYLK